MGRGSLVNEEERASRQIGRKRCGILQTNSGMRALPVGILTALAPFSRNNTDQRQPSPE